MFLSTHLTLLIVAIMCTRSTLGQDCACFDSFFPFGGANGDTLFGSTDDDEYADVFSQNTFFHRSSTFTQIFVSTNGHISFEEGYDDYDRECELPVEGDPHFIALYQIDIQHECSGTISYRLSTDEGLLTTADSYIHCDDPDFVAVEALILTFYETGLYDCFDIPGVLVSYQGVLVTDGVSKTHLLTRYERLDMEDGDPILGVIGDQSFTAGYNHPLSCARDNRPLLQVSTLQNCPGVYSLDVSADASLSFNDLLLPPGVEWCDYNLCANDATCISFTDPPFVCLCDADYVDRTDCLPRACDVPDSCFNNGTCIADPNQVDYSCTCEPGFTGSRCEDAIPCYSDPCMYGATCTNEMDGYICHCAPGYQGDQCQTEIDECESNPCMHDGTCTDDIAAYACQCMARYEGEHCELEVCDRWEAEGYCLNEGYCANTLDNIPYCWCVDGYTGMRCQVAPPLLSTPIISSLTVAGLLLIVVVALIIFAVKLMPGAPTKGAIDPNTGGPPKQIITTMYSNPTAIPQTTMYSNPTAIPQSPIYYVPASNTQAAIGQITNI